MDSRSLDSTSGVDAALPACRLVRLIGRPPAAWTVDDLSGLVAELRVRLVSLMHVGGDGWLKTLDFVPRDRAHLRDVLAGGERADGSSLFGGLGISVSASDVLLRPRLDTAFLDPLAASPTLVVLCSHFGRDGRPLPESPDTIVRRAYERLRAETGVELHALGEVEYFLGKRPDDGDIYGAAERGYHASAPFVFGEALRRRALVLLSEIGVPVKYGHSEVGYIEADETDERIWEQHEIEMALEPLPRAADSVAIAQWLLRNLAHQQGLRCSFEPVLREGHAGSGMHFHLAPVSGGRPEPVIAPGEALSPHAAALVGGLVESAAALMAFGNRSPRSFVRLRQGREAPTTVTWGWFNRQALVRLPIVATDESGRAIAAETVEFRLPDGSAHPHLLLAGVAQAMASGRALPLDRLLAATAAGGGDTAGDGHRVPRTFAEVADRLQAARHVFEQGGVFPPHVIDRVASALASA